MDEDALRLDLEERVGECWGDVDMEGNGILDGDELAQVLAALGVEGIDEDAVLEQLDEDQSGVVEWEAFSAWYIEWGVEQAQAHEQDDDDELGDLLDDLDGLGGSSDDETAEADGVAEALAGIDDLDIGGTDSDSDVDGDGDEDDGDDDLLAGLDDLDDMSDFSDMSQDEDDNAPEPTLATNEPAPVPEPEPELPHGQVAQAERLAPRVPSLVERMKASSAANPEPEEEEEEEEEEEQEEGESDEIDGLDSLDGLDSFSDDDDENGSGGGDDDELGADSSSAPAQAAAQPDPVPAPARDRAPSGASDLEGLRGAGLVGRLGSRFGQGRVRSVEELLVVDPNERGEDELDVLFEWSRSIKGR
jgi:hypothetical protein